MKFNLMQIVRLVLMVLAIAGIIYAVEYVPRGIAVWFWVALLGIGFVGLLYTFRLTQRRLRREARDEEQRAKRKLLFLHVDILMCRFRVKQRLR